VILARYCHSVVMELHYVGHENYDEIVDYFYSQGMIIIKSLLSYLSMFSIDCKSVNVNQLNLANNLLKSY
jgi:hypothetical protein